ncbi:gamma-glutamyltranspeptidase/glutathione hydrolase [Bacillus chungangensis]|uniref:Glutathione hydrolase proenzyme n=1 Tax=Bacillus chungangensis TaxID=587633 RepID=A0ABT9WWR6_9BACI|nr:gamma-glutamyltranspeptidase/glutathione hydrolase [Bacillus chungangensis]
MRNRMKKLVWMLLVVFMTLFSISSVSAGYRPTTMSPNGMVTTPHYLASQSALQVLQEGGNAVDAAVAASATLAVVYPHMNGIGGDNFWLIYNAETGELKALNASGRSGEKATIDFYKKQGFETIPSRGYLSTNTVPGAISGWEEAYQYAKKTMKNSAKWDRLLEDSIMYAEKGFPVTPSQAYWAEVNLDPNDQDFRNLQRFQGFADTFLKSNGESYKEGEIFKQEALANTLKVIANQGADGFYKGEIAEKIIADLQDNGGLLTLKDFEDHRANWVDPIMVEYRGYQAYNFPPNTQGVASLSILNILNNFDMKKIEEGSADYYHVLVEATKQAFADRDKYVTDPEFVDIPLDYMLSKEHGKKMADRIDMNKAATDVNLLDPKGDTVWLGVVDKDGNAVSIIQSIYHEYGSGIVAKDTGVLLQNRGSFFSLDENHINRLEPKKRTFSTLNPAMMFKDDKPFLVYGTMGGEGQPQTQAAIITRIVDYGFSVQDAIEAPRWLHGRRWGASSNDLKIEGRVPDDVVQELIKRGHPVKVLEDFTDTMGHAGAILIDSTTNVRYGGADPRGDGAAVGY